MTGKDTGGDGEPRLWSVTDLARYLSDYVSADPALAGVLVRGEVTNLYRHVSGHLYFKLADAGAVLPCAFFGAAKKDLGFELKDGVTVIAEGSVNIYARRGEYQMKVVALQAEGLGRLYQIYEATKKRLADEGLFEPARKQPVPAFPKHIGVVTAAGGRACSDILKVLGERYPLAQVTVCDTAVQDAHAPAEMIAALRHLERCPDIDVIILARGGGSFEDLFCFNDESLARAVAACRVPVVTGVGHEADVTIVDFVADVRGATPSNAAEQATPDRPEVLRHVRALRNRHEQAVRAGLRHRQAHLTALAQSRGLHRPGFKMEQQLQYLDELVGRIRESSRRSVERRAARLSPLAARMEQRVTHSLGQATARAAGLRRQLEALSPTGVLKRGFAICFKNDGQTIVRSVNEVEVDRTVFVRVADGKLDSIVRRKEVLGDQL